MFLFKLRRVLHALLCFNSVAVTAGEAGEKPEVVASVYQFSWQKDLTIMVTTGAAWTALSSTESTFVRRSCPCDSDSLNAIDRRTVHEESQAAAAQSNTAVAVLAPLPFLLTAWDTQQSNSDWANFGADSAMMIEAYLFSGLLTESFKIGVQRPRPLTYDKPADDPRLDIKDNYLSFYSAHTSGVFSAGMAFASTYARHHPTSKLSYAAYGAVILAGTYVGTLRVLAGKHFPTDVAAGAVMGSAVGLAWPALHDWTLFGGNFYLASERQGPVIAFRKELH